MKSRFTIVENSGDPSQLTPMEIALSRCSWTPWETSSEAGDHTEPEATDDLDACLVEAMGTLREYLSSKHLESRDVAPELLDTQGVVSILASSGIGSGRLDPADCSMEIVDSVPSAEGLLLRVLLRQKDRSSGDVDGLPLSVIQ